jgi:predicted ATPase
MPWKDRPGLAFLPAPVVLCLCDKAQAEWHLGEIAPSRGDIAEAIALAKELNVMHGLAEALFFAGLRGYYERNTEEVERLASDLIELCTRQNFALWLPGGKILRGWTQSISGHTAEGIARIKEGIEDWRASGSIIGINLWLSLRAEALHLADRTSEALAAVREAETLAERFEGRWWSAELHRLRGVFITALGAARTEIEGAFRAAIRTAKEQKSVS